MTLAAASRSLGLLPPSAAKVYFSPRAPVATTDTEIGGNLRDGGLGGGRLGTPEGVHLAGAPTTSTAATTVSSGVTDSVVASSTVVERQIFNPERTASAKLPTTIKEAKTLVGVRVVS